MKNHDFSNGWIPWAPGWAAILVYWRLHHVAPLHFASSKDVLCWDTDLKHGREIPCLKYTWCPVYLSCWASGSCYQQWLLVTSAHPRLSTKMGSTTHVHPPFRWRDSPRNEHLYQPSSKAWGSPMTMEYYGNLHMGIPKNLIYPVVIQHGYGKLPFLDLLPISKRWFYEASSR